jgi:hypothetical protein
MKAIPGFHPSGQAKPVLKRSWRFSASSKKEVSKKMPFPVTCPQKAAGSRKCYEKMFS